MAKGKRYSEHQILAVLKEIDNGATIASVNSVTTSFTYDDIDQLLTESRTGYSASYTFDANGNRLTKTLNGTTENYTYDDADKMLTAGGKSYGYDACGRTTSVTVGGNTTTLDYDYEDRLTQITYPSTATNTFSYNGLDTRVGKVDSAGTATYLRDGAGVTAPVINDGTANYTPGVSERRSGSTSFVNADRLGSTTHLTDATEATTDTREYDAYGQTVSSTGSTATPFGFVGKAGYQQDADSGLMLLGHRYYDASTGRFITRDPVKDGRNWFSYANNNPATRLDPAGLMSFMDLSQWADDHLFGGQAAATGAAWGDWESGQGSGWAVAGHGGLLLAQMIMYATGIVGVGKGIAALGTAAGSSLARALAIDGGEGIVDELAEMSAQRVAKMRAGTVMHQEIQAAYEGLGEGWESEVTLGNSGRADLLNRELRQVVEIKPHNDRAIGEGLEQLQRYIDWLDENVPGDKPWTGWVEPY